VDVLHFVEYKVSKDTYVKKVLTSTGKEKFQAAVWYQGVFYTSKTFDVKALAVKFKQAALLQVIRGELLPAKARRQEREVQQDLDQPMTHWANEYVKENPDEHGVRLNDYSLVGKLLANKTLKDFHGRRGGQLIAQLKIDWRFDRQARSHNAELNAAGKVKPLSDNSIRLRLTALIRILRFAGTKVSEDTPFRVPDMKMDVFAFTLPPAHGDKRQRLPSDSEYAKLLNYPAIPEYFADFLKVIDETGCRLSEIRNAKNSDIDFFCSQGVIVGGCLTLLKHKTIKKTKQPRFVPLSQSAAQILAERVVDVFGDGPLFGHLGSADDVCKAFDNAREALGLENLLIKDFRRSFINRNKGSLSNLDLFAITGDTSLLDMTKASESEKAVATAVGHTTLKTTAAYSVADLQRLARVFTLTSRLKRVMAMVEGNAFTKDWIRESEMSLHLNPSDALSDNSLLQVSIPIPVSTSVCV
jgi:integrase